ncbi:MAG TPA: hypothetical protein VG714_02625 [Acidobacteriaceae bacterium]|nr:hypothetical protein [Acidobacteriaceae bacterium]
MAFRRAKIHLPLSALSGALLGATALAIAVPSCSGQVFVVGEKTAMSDVSTDFHPTRIELPSVPITERGRRDLLRNLEAEQGFAHRPLPLGTDVTLIANGNLTPNGDAYKEMLYKKGESAQVGDRVAITNVTVKDDRIILDLNGGPYLKHRFLRHIQINDMNLVPNDGAQVSGCRITLLFEGGVPEISAPEVKALLDPLIDFSVKTSAEAYADSLPPFLKDAIAQHDVLVGMNRRMVLAAMGQPWTKSRELLPGSDTRHFEEWVYGHVPETVRFVRFVDDRVIQVRVAALGQPIAIHDQNEMHGYTDPDSVREVAEGDTGPAEEGDTGGHAPPTILKPGESAPGSMRRVLLPSTPIDQDKDGSRDGSGKTQDGQSGQPAATPGQPVEPPSPTAHPQFQTAELER